MTYPERYPFPQAGNFIISWQAPQLSQWCGTGRGQADSQGDHCGGRWLAASLAEDHVGAVAARWPRGAQDEDRATRTHLGLDLGQEVRRWDRKSWVMSSLAMIYFCWMLKNRVMLLCDSL